MLESDSFDSVQELVRFYVGQRKAVSQSSGAHIYCPVSRTLPLRYLEATFALSNSKHSSAYSPSSQRGAYIKRRSVTMTDGLTTEKMMPHRWGERGRRCSLTVLSLLQLCENCYWFFYVAYIISDSDSPSPVETPLAPPEPEPEPVSECRLCLCVWQQWCCSGSLHTPRAPSLHRHL